jgi:uncharacterized repeat protein (TIGR01451 family)
MKPMVRRSKFFAVVALVALWTGSTRAQDAEQARPRRSASLSERLDQFRRDLLGDRNGPKEADPPPVTRKVTRKARPSGSPPPIITKAPPAGDEETAGEQQMSPARVPIAPPTDVAAPVRLQPQAARRATGGGGLNSATVEPADLANRIKQERAAAGTRRPVVVRPLRDESPAAPGGASDSASEDESKSTDDAQPAAEAKLHEDSAGEKSPPEPHLATMPAEGEPEREAADDAGKTEPAGKDKPRERELDRDSSKLQSQAGEDEPAAGVLFTGQSPVLSVVASGPRKVLIGKEAHFVVRIRNAGSAANNVVVSINIPSYAELLAAQATSGTAHAAGQGDRREPLEWKIARLDAGGEESLNLKLVPRKSNPLDLAMRWTFTPEASQTMVEVQEPKLAMTILGPDEVLFGQSKIYKLTVSNPGNGDTENVSVGLLPIGRSTETAANHRLGTLKAGESKTIDIELTARQAGAITIKAQAFAEGGLRAEAAEQVLVRRASLRIEVLAPKVKYAGTVGTYRVKIINAGNATAENVQVAAMLPPDAKYVASTGNGRHEPQAGKVTWAVGTMQPGAERLFDLQCSLSSPGENRTQFAANGDGDLSSSTTSTTHVEAIADLKLEVRDPQGPIAVGEDTVYEVHVRNRGTKPAEDIDLTVFFSEGLEATSVDGGPHDIATGQVIFRPVVSLAAGETAVFRVHARADKPGNHVFRAELASKTPQVHLAAEEATHFYGDDRASSFEPLRERAPRMARRESSRMVPERAERTEGPTPVADPDQPGRTD